jgi:hypothetical protein
MAGCRGEAIVASGARGPRASTSKGIVRGRFPGPHRALPQGVGAAPVYLAGALGLNATPQAPAGVLNLGAHPRLTADQPACPESRRSSRAHSPDFRREAAALPRSVSTKLCKGFVRTVSWFPHTSEPWLAGSRAPRAAVGRRVCPVRAIPASRMRIARDRPEHALIGGRREASLRWPLRERQPGRGRKRGSSSVAARPASPNFSTTQYPRNVSKIRSMSWKTWLIRGATPKCVGTRRISS